MRYTIIYLLIDWEIKGTPFYSRTETGGYVRVSVFQCGFYVELFFMTDSET